MDIIIPKKIYSKNNEWKKTIWCFKKNQKYFEDNENLKKNIQKSFKLYLKKKRERTREKDEEYQKVQNEGEEYKTKKIMKLKKIKKINNVLNENEKVQEKEDIEKIKQMDNEEDLFNAILAWF